jgi:hypothetical protein
MFQNKSQYSKSVFTTEDLSSIPQIPAVKLNEVFPINNIIVSTEGIANLLDKLNTSKASGPDQMPLLLLKISLTCMCSL